MEFIAGEYSHLCIFLAQLHQVIKIVDGRVIHRVGFSGPDNLYRVFFIIEQFIKSFFIAGNQVGPFITGEPARPNDGEYIRVEQTARLVGDDFKLPFLQKAFAVVPPEIVTGFQFFIELFIGPVCPVLCIGYMNDRADSNIFTPHGT
jgi:hypothetical protein